jgi:16S rRNA (adenine1518-N6/adenine1519-N6)-dimethyltransferase
VKEFPRARKRFGQHFLEPAWVRRLVDLVAPAADDTFLEIGPGRGALTRELAPRVGRLIAVEIDRDLADRLRTADLPHVEVVTGDFLTTDVRSLLGDDVPRARIIGNLPYNVSSPILFKVLHAQDDGARFTDATLMLQREVAERLTASPGDGAYGALAIQVARIADVATVLTLPPGAFRPPPKVTSAVVRLRFRPPAVDVGNVATFEKVVRGAFLQRRKMVQNALEPVAAGFGLNAAVLLDRAGVDPRKRPEALTLDEFARLARAVL